MKKILSAISLICLMVAAGCEKGPNAPEYPTPESGVKYVFEGTVATAGFTWTSASSIGLYSMTEGVNVLNEQCKIDGWSIPVDPSTLEEGQEVPEFVPSPYEGKPSAPFNSPAMDLVKGVNKFLVYTPYDPEMSYIPSLQTIYNLSISDSQTQPAPNVAGDCFSFGISEAVPGMDEVFPFELNPITAMLKVNVSSNEFDGYGIRKVTIVDESGNAKLGGTFDVSISDMAFTSYTTFSKVAMTVLNPRPMKAGESQSVFINILPGDYSSTEFTITVELVSDKGTVTIPMKKNGIKCKAGETTDFNLKDLKSSDNIYPWYCPVENRKLVGCAYAYGDQNTYLIQSKTAVYGGVTLAPVDDIPEEVTIDYRLRGDLSKAEAPVGVTFDWATLASGAVYYVRTDNGFNSSDFSITVDEANFQVKVKCGAATGGAPILLMKKDNKILWGWAFWNIAADGSRLEPVTIGSHQFANMTIGQATPNIKAWIAGIGTTRVTVNKTIYYYQWGRYLPAIFWNATVSGGFIATAAGQEAIPQVDGNVPLIQGPFATLREALDWPYGAITHYNSDEEPTKQTANMVNWTDEYIGDLWGCDIGKKNNAGTKSIYDPCPKGWRVPDYSALVDIETFVGLHPTADKFETTTGCVGLYAGNMYIPYSGYWTYAKLGATNYRATNYGASVNFANGASFTWGNYCGSHEQTSPFAYRWFGSNHIGDDYEARVEQYVRATAAGVRCQKDEANR
jgi:hypothetical protein